MKYFGRKVTKREPINRFGKLGFVPYWELFKTSDMRVYDQFNARKAIPFEELTNKALIAFLRKGQANSLYTLRVEG